ncbi:MAG: uroporphyrinogen decarboxylase family protein [Candidatus Izemoplasmatales bacterium]|nr:uroporphyrinogen decarboxylase family protein [Candidatus Izemoplasmatales bacterium]
MLLDIHQYKINIDKTFQENYQLYHDAYHKRPGNVSLRVLPPCDVSFYEKIDLTKYDFEKDIEQYTTDLLGLLDQSYQTRKTLDDNMIPTVFPILGIGDYSAFLAGDIIFKPDTSWGEHVLKEIDDWKKLPPYGSTKWYRLFMMITERLIQKSAKQGIPYMRGFFSPLDLAHALRGEDIYYDFYDEPEKLHELLDYCATMTIRFAEDIYRLVDKYGKDTTYGTWYTRKQINMSEDIACMISGDTYREFCRPHTQRVVNHFGSGYMHCHSRAMYLVKEICDMDHIVHLWLATDPNQPRPIDHVAKLVNDAQGAVMAIDCDTFAEIEKNYEAMKKGNFSICLPVKSVEEGEMVIQRFRQLEATHR